MLLAPQDRKPLFELEDLPELTEQHLKDFPDLAGVDQTQFKAVSNLLLQAWSDVRCIDPLFMIS